MTREGVTILRQTATWAGPAFLWVFAGFFLSVLIFWVAVIAQLIVSTVGPWLIYFDQLSR